MQCSALQCSAVQNWKKNAFFVNFKILGMHIWRKIRVNYDKFVIATNCVNQIFNLNAFFFFLFTGTTWYYHNICLVITYFASFTNYEDDIFEVISNWHVHGFKFGEKINKFGGKSKKKKKKKTSRSSWSLFLSGLVQCIGLLCTALHWNVVNYSALQCFVVHCSVLKCIPVNCSEFQCIAMHCSVFECIELHCSPL